MPISMYDHLAASVSSEALDAFNRISAGSENHLLMILTRQCRLNCFRLTHLPYAHATTQVLATAKPEYSLANSPASNFLSS